MTPLIEAMQSNLAQVVIGPSAVRGPKRKGVAKNAREFLETLPLRQFATPDQDAFQAVLGDATGQLERALPEEAQCWGLARKCLNLFLRSAFYNRYLAEAFDLCKAETCFEIPLDSQVAKGLERLAKSYSNHADVPRWKGLNGLTSDDNNKYQKFGQELAKEKCLPARVHLDLYLWRDESLCFS